MANKKVLHKRSGVEDKEPTKDQLDYGELAINYTEGGEKVFIKNSNNEIVAFIPKRAFIEATVVHDTSSLLGTIDNELIRTYPSDMGGVTYTYSVPTITLTYGTAVNTASSISPSSFTYSQTRTGSDGTTATITDGATVSFAISDTVGGITINSSTGEVSFGTNSSDSQRSLCTVTVTVTMNGERSTCSVPLYQAARSSVNTEYGALTVSLYYGIASNTASTISPSSSRTQTVTYTHSDGTISTDVISPTTTSISYAIETSVSGVTINSSSGVVTFPTNSTEDERILGTVTVTVVAHDMTGTANYTITQAAKTYTDTYSFSGVSLTYDGIPNTGGDSSPILGYTIVRTRVYSDGTTETETLPADTVADIRYSISGSASIDCTSGVVTCDANPNESTRTVGTVTVALIYGGTLYTATATVSQTARTIVSETYSTPSVSLSYGTASATATSLTPTYSGSPAYSYGFRKFFMIK